jgi:hypothetical protein
LRLDEELYFTDQSDDEELSQLKRKKKTKRNPKKQRARAPQLKFGFKEKKERKNDFVKYLGTAYVPGEL